MENQNDSTIVLKYVGLFIGLGLFIYIMMSFFGPKKAPDSQPDFGSDNEVIFSNHSGEIASSSFAVGGTAVQVLPRNAGRLFARCSNYGTPNVSLAIGGNGSKSWGILIPASSAYEFTKDKNLYLGPVYAITHGGTTRVSCVEASGR